MPADTENVPVPLPSDNRVHTGKNFRQIIINNVELLASPFPPISSLPASCLAFARPAAAGSGGKRGLHGGNN